MQYFNARYYVHEVGAKRHPVVGTFVSPDSIVPDAGSVFSYNRFMFVSGNPLNRVDPTGHQDVGALTSNPTFWQLASQAEATSLSIGPAGPVMVTIVVVGVAGYDNTTWDLPYIEPIYPEVLSEDGFTVSIPIPGSTTLTSPQLVLSSNKDNEIGVGSANGDRAGQVFTKKGKKVVTDANREANEGDVVCEKCGVVTIPSQKSTTGVTPPTIEAQVDHIIPRSHGGDGSPSNGQILCRGCNRSKSNNIE